MVRNYATLDAATLPADTTLEQSGTTAYTAAPATPQTVRSTLGKTLGIWYVEWIAYGTLGSGSGSDLRVGVCLAAAGATVALGEDANSVAWCADGRIRSAGATVSTEATWTLGDVIGCEVNAASRIAVLRKNGSPVATITVPGTDEAMTPAATLVAGAGSDDITPELRILYSAGQRTQEHAPGASGTASGINAGWFEVAANIGLLRAADRAFRSLSSDSPALAHWPDGISNQAFPIARTLHFPPWGGGGAQQAQATLRLDNASGEFDALLAEDARDAEVRVRTLAKGAALADAQPVATLVVDAVRAPNDMSIEVTLRDTTATLQSPAQRRLILPTADEAVQAKPWPFVLGAVRSLPLTCLDAENQVYAINDGPVAGVGSIRDRGDPFAPSLGDYILAADGPGTVTLASIAQGKVTADVSSVGGDTPEPPADLLAGTGDFGNAENAALWSTVTNGATDDYSVSGGKLTGASFSEVSGVKIPGFSMTAGVTYMFRLTMSRLVDTRYATTGNTTPTDYLCLARPRGFEPDFFDALGSQRIYTPGTKDAWNQGYDPAFDLASQPIVIIASSPYDAEVWLALHASNYGASFQIASIVVWQLRDAELDDESLQPMPLADTLQQLLEGRAGWPRSKWSIDDARAIDAATGYAGVGIASTTEAPLTTMQAVQLVLDAYWVSTWQDEAGVLRFTRLVDPATVEPAGDIGIDDMLSEPDVTLDLAPGLTTQLGARKNWMPLQPSEMVSDDVGLPNSLDGGDA